MAPSTSTNTCTSVLAFEQVALDHLRPVLADPVGDLGVAVAGQVDERAAAVELEHVDQLRASRGVADAGQLLGVGEGVDERRLPDVGPTDERHLGGRRRELRHPGRGRHEPQSERSAVHQPTMSEPSAHTAATNPTNAIARLRAIGARGEVATRRVARRVAARSPSRSRRTGRRRARAPARPTGPLRGTSRHDGARDWRPWDSTTSHSPPVTPRPPTASTPR